MPQLLTYKIALKRQILRSAKTIKLDAKGNKEFKKNKPAQLNKTKQEKKQENKKRWYTARRKINKYLRVARLVAEYSIKRHYQKRLYSSDVKHLGNIPSCISNCIIEKYQMNKKCKKVTNVNLIVPACSTVKYPSIIHEEEVLTIKPLQLRLKWKCPKNYEKINQIEINNKYCFVTVTVSDYSKQIVDNMIGVDMNIKHNLASVGNPNTKQIDYLGKGHIYKRSKYLNMRARYQRQNRNARVKQMGNKEHRVMTNINHTVSKQIINLAWDQEANIGIEDLKGIRKAPARGNFRKFKHTWAFYQLRTFIEYKAEYKGIYVYAVDPAYTSQDCSDCGNRKKVKGKKYVCDNCGLEIHRDENASYNIANRAIAMQQNVDLVLGDALEATQ